VLHGILETKSKEILHIGYTFYLWDRRTALFVYFVVARCHSTGVDRFKGTIVSHLCCSSCEHGVKPPECSCKVDATDQSYFCRQLTRIQTDIRIKVYPFLRQTWEGLCRITSSSDCRYLDPCKRNLRSMSEVESKVATKLVFIFAPEALRRLLKRFYRAAGYLVLGRNRRTLYP